MAVQYTIRADARQAINTFGGLSNAKQKDELQTRRNEVASNRLSAAEERNTISVLRKKLAKDKLTISKRK